MGAEPHRGPLGPNISPAMLQTSTYIEYLMGNIIQCGDIKDHAGRTNEQNGMKRKIWQFTFDVVYRAALLNLV